MSTADSSVPSPTFAVAPELPAGVQRRTPPERPRWKPWTAWVALIAAFGGALMGALLVGIVGAIGGADLSDPTPAVNIAATIVQDVCFVAAAVLFAGMAGRPLPAQFGLRRTRFWPALGWVGLAFLAFYIFTVVFGAIHIGSAEVALLVPLAFFGFVLCLLRERTGSLLPCIVLHCANNSVAFGVSQDWGWEIPVLFVSALAIITLVALVVRAT